MVTLGSTEFYDELYTLSVLVSQKTHSFSITNTDLVRKSAHNLRVFVLLLNFVKLS